MDRFVVYQIASYVYKTFSIVFLLSGILCNVLSALVYTKRKMRKTSYSVYLFTLAIVDLLVTLTGNTRLLFMSHELNNFLQFENSTIVMLRRTFYSEERREIFKGFDLRETNLIVCKVHRFLTYFLLQFSSIILCMLSIDRFFGCVLVLKAGDFCKPSVARKILCSIFIFLTVFNVHFFTSMGHIESRYDPETNTTFELCKCEPPPLNEIYQKFWSFYFYLDCMIYCIVPFIIMLTCNILIIWKIIKSRVNSKQVVIRKSKQVTNSSSGNYMLPSERRISIILIGISASFFVLTLPIFIMENFSNSVFISNISNPIMELFLSIANALMYSNHVINFFFYCSLGPNFRKEVRKLLPRFLFRNNRVEPMKAGRFYQSNNQNLTTQNLNNYQSSISRANLANQNSTYVKMRGNSSQIVLANRFNNNYNYNKKNSSQFSIFYCTATTNASISILNNQNSNTLAILESKLENNNKKGDDDDIGENEEDEKVVVNRVYKTIC
jgi:hypothetical protein